MKNLISLVAFLALPLAAQTATAIGPIANTEINSGEAINLQSPHNPSTFLGYGLLANNASSSLPTFVGSRLDGYLDSNHKPVVVTTVTAKIVPWRNGRFFTFVDGTVGAASGSSGFSSALSVGGGLGVLLGKAATDLTKTPHWAIVLEPKAIRIPALAPNPNTPCSGFCGSVALAAVYSFNRPQ